MKTKSIKLNNNLSDKKKNITVAIQAESLFLLVSSQNVMKQAAVSHTQIANKIVVLIIIAVIILIIG